MGPEFFQMDESSWTHIFILESMGLRRDGFASELVGQRMRLCLLHLPFGTVYCGRSVGTSRRTVPPGTAHLLHSLLVVPEMLQLPLGPFRELLEDLLPPGGGLGRHDGQGERLH